MFRKNLPSLLFGCISLPGRLLCPQTQRSLPFAGAWDYDRQWSMDVLKLARLCEQPSGKSHKTHQRCCLIYKWNHSQDKAHTQAWSKQWYNAAPLLLMYLCINVNAVVTTLMHYSLHFLLSSFVIYATKCQRFIFLSWPKPFIKFIKCLSLWASLYILHFSMEHDTFLSTYHISSDRRNISILFHLNGTDRGCSGFILCPNTCMATSELLRPHSVS